MSTKYKILKYHRRFENQVIDLQSHLWSPDKYLNSRYLEWKYHNNPYREEPMIYLLLCDDLVVGMRGMYGAKWQFGQIHRSSIILCAGDAVIHPNHRNRGLLTYLTSGAMYDLSSLGHEYAFNLSASPNTLITSLGMGWQSIGLIQTMYWLSESHDQWTYSSKRFFVSSDEDDHPFYSLDKGSSEGLNGIRPNISINSSPKPKEMAALVDRNNNNERIKHVRDEQYFKWRFENPLSQYRFLYWGDNTLEGYMVVQASVYTENIGWVAIVDFEATSQEVFRDLLMSILQIGKFGYMTIWTSTVSSDNKSILKECGFKFRNERLGVADPNPTFLVGKTKTNAQNEDWALFNVRLLDSRNWDIRMVFSDTY